MNKTITDLLPERMFFFLRGKNHSENAHSDIKNLSDAEINKEYTIKEVIQDNREIVDFLFTLGCFKGESITLISVLSETYVIGIKDARYSIDLDLAKMIILA